MLNGKIGVEIVLWNLGLNNSPISVYNILKALSFLLAMAVPQWSRRHVVLRYEYWPSTCACVKKVIRDSRRMWKLFALKLGVAPGPFRFILDDCDGRTSNIQVHRQNRKSCVLYVARWNVRVWRPGWGVGHPTFAEKTGWSLRLLKDKTIHVWFILTVTTIFPLLKKSTVLH